jgi:Predicted 3'-5' exonuclease related to the exonuclease domain of PolB
MRGDEVEKYYHDGHIREIAEYCESDVVNTYRLWLRYELFRGRLSDADFHASELSLVDFIKARANTKPHIPTACSRAHPGGPPTSTHPALAVRQIAPAASPRGSWRWLGYTAQSNDCC